MLVKEVWLNRKYFYIKRNCNLKNKFFGLFYVLYLIDKQVGKLKLPKN